MERCSGANNDAVGPDAGITQDEAGGEPTTQQRVSQRIYQAPRQQNKQLIANGQKAMSRQQGSDVSGAVALDHLLAAKQILIDKGLDDEWEAVVANEDELQLDWDSSSCPCNFAEQLGILCQVHGPINIKYSISKSGNGRHLIIKLAHNMLLETRIAWQAVLGSDSKREALCLVSVAKGELNPVLLFERKK